MYFVNRKLAETRCCQCKALPIQPSSFQLCYLNQYNQEGGFGATSAGNEGLIFRKGDRPVFNFIFI